LAVSTPAVPPVRVTVTVALPDPTFSFTEYVAAANASVPAAATLIVSVSVSVAVPSLVAIWSVALPLNPFVGVNVALISAPLMLDAVPLNVIAVSPVGSPAVTLMPEVAPSATVPFVAVSVTVSELASGSLTLIALEVPGENSSTPFCATPCVAGRVLTGASFTGGDVDRDGVRVGLGAAGAGVAQSLVPTVSVTRSSRWRRASRPGRSARR
jgi:hypothetical protein